jgi:hypothetical protein
LLFVKSPNMITKGFGVPPLRIENEHDAGTTPIHLELLHAREACQVDLE